jgi:anti-anti-sigma regulatory factor
MSIVLVWDRSSRFFSRTRSVGGEFILAAVPQNVRNLLHITRLDTVFVISDTIEDALKRLGSSAG